MCGIDDEFIDVVSGSLRVASTSSATGPSNALKSAGFKSHSVMPIPLSDTTMVCAIIPSALRCTSTSNHSRPRVEAVHDQLGNRFRGRCVLLPSKVLGQHPRACALIDSEKDVGPTKESVVVALTGARRRGPGPVWPDGSVDMSRYRNPYCCAPSPRAGRGSPVAVRPGSQGQGHWARPSQPRHHRLLSQSLRSLKRPVPTTHRPIPRQLAAGPIGQARPSSP